MLPRRWITVLCTLSLAYLVVTKAVSDAECQNYTLRLIKEYFRRTSIVRGDSTDVEYCESSTPHLRPLIDLNQVIELYQSLDHVDNRPNYFKNSPIRSYGVLHTDQDDLPLYVIADIRKQHLPGPNSYPEFGSDVIKQMELMGQLNSDDQAYLLAHSLGGTSRALNIVPMARNVNRHISTVPDSADLGVPRSNWRSNEHWIRRFLMWDYPDGHVTWKVAIQYQDEVIDSGNSCDYRPVSFTAQFTAYTNQHDNSSVCYVSPQKTFFNDNDHLCGPGESYLRPRREVNLQLKCGVHDPSSSTGNFGSPLSQGRWDNKHILSFPYAVQGRTFFYGYVLFPNGHFYFIQELLSDGQMGEEITKARLPEKEKSLVVAVPFFINGRQYFYRQSDNGRWYVQELLAEGKMGQEVQQGEWSKVYDVSFAFTISGKHYFYAESGDGNIYFIRELLSNGTIGQETERGRWEVHYQVALPLSINGRLFFYAHSTSDRSWWVRELLPGGKTGEVTDRGIWKTRHQVSVPYSIEGKQYYFAQSILDGRHWFIQNPQSAGKIGEESSQGIWNDSYPVVFAYTVGERYFLYLHSHDTHQWIIKELL